MYITYFINKVLLELLLDTILESIKKTCIPKLTMQRKLRIPLGHSI